MISSRSIPLLCLLVLFYLVANFDLSCVSCDASGSSTPSGDGMTFHVLFFIFVVSNLLSDFISVFPYRINISMVSDLKVCPILLP